jgi:hypothetical protein
MALGYHPLIGCIGSKFYGSVQWNQFRLAWWWRQNYKPQRIRMTAATNQETDHPLLSIILKDAS